MKTSWTVGDRQVMTTVSVGRAWERFRSEICYLVQQSFCSIRLALPICRDCDSELNIKGFTPQDLKIGDWSKDYNVAV